MENTPKTIFEIKPTYACNMSCNFCVFAERKGEFKSLTTEYIEKSIMDTCKEIDEVDTFIISGGEPTLRPDFWTMLNLVRTVVDPKKIILHSNGLRLSSNEDIYRLKELGVTLFLSFHTVSEKTFSLLTNTGYHGVLLANIDRFANSGVDIMTDTVIMEPNQLEVEAIGEYLFQRNIRNMEFRFPFGVSSRINQYPWVIPTHFSQIVSQLSNLEERRHSGLNLFIHPSLPCVIKQKISPDLESSTALKTVFDIARRSVTSESFLSGEGIKYIFLGPERDLKKGSFQQDALNNGYEQPFLRVPYCNVCEFSKYCLGTPIEFIVNETSLSSFYKEC